LEKLEQGQKRKIDSKLRRKIFTIIDGNNDGLSIFNPETDSFYCDPRGFRYLFEKTCRDYASTPHVLAERMGYDLRNLQYQLNCLNDDDEVPEDMVIAFVKTTKTPLKTVFQYCRDASEWRGRTEASSKPWLRATQ
jgi:hypothetical protein